MGTTKGKRLSSSTRARFHPIMSAYCVQTPIAVTSRHFVPLCSMLYTLLPAVELGFKDNQRATYPRRQSEKFMELANKTARTSSLSLYPLPRSTQQAGLRCATIPLPPAEGNGLHEERK